MTVLHILTIMITIYFFMMILMIIDKHGLGLLFRVDISLGRVNLLQDFLQIAESPTSIQHQFLSKPRKGNYIIINCIDRTYQSTK